MSTVEIWDGPSVQLRDLLDQLPGVDGLRWSVMEIWTVARSDATDVSSIESRAAGSPKGLEMRSSELRELADELAQVIDGIFAGYRGEPPSRSDKDLRHTTEIVIEAFDSTFWRVYARDAGVAEQLRRTYTDVRDVLPETPIPASHALS
jgi:hypothetical protein